MAEGLRIAFFGSSLVSAYWNGAATYYRGLLSALAARGHRITFYEPDAFERQKHRDIADPDWARVVVYSSAGTDAMHRCLEEAKGADLIVKASGVGVFDRELEGAVLALKRPENIVAYWDVDAPATLERIHQDADDPFHPLIPKYDVVFTYGGGDPVVRAYTAVGARRCVPIYNALDPSTHYPVPAEERFACDLSFLGNRLPDREARVEAFFLKAAESRPARRFLLGGNGWADKPMPKNVAYVGHVYTKEHNAFNCSSLAVLNVSRQSMADYGFSPATRVFEAAGAGACLITDEWVGIDTFLEPGRHVLVARNGEEVAAHLDGLTPEKAGRIGQAAMEHVCQDHTYAQRAVLVEKVLAETKGSGTASAPRKKESIAEGLCRA